MGLKKDLSRSFTLSIFLEGFEMTRIVIPNECEESFPSIFILCGRVQLMIHFVVNTSLLNFAPLRFRGRYCEFGCFAAAGHAGIFLLSGYSIDSLRFFTLSCRFD